MGNGLTILSSAHDLIHLILNDPVVISDQFQPFLPHIPIAPLSFKDLLCQRFRNRNGLHDPAHSFLDFRIVISRSFQSPLTFSAVSPLPVNHLSGDGIDILHDNILDIRQPSMCRIQFFSKPNPKKQQAQSDETGMSPRQLQIDLLSEQEAVWCS